MDGEFNQNPNPEVIIMLENTLWHRASQIQIQTPSNIVPGFSIGFDSKIPANVQAELRNFVGWVEAHFNLPVTLWVDFEYKHYLLDRRKERVGFLFYWTDFESYPVFENEDDIPVIRLPVRTEHASLEEILSSFIEAISCYYAWISNMIADDYSPDENEVEEILRAYLSCKI